LMGYRTGVFAAGIIGLLGACGTEQGPKGGTVTVESIAPPDSGALALAAIEEKIVKEPGNAAHYAERAAYYAAQDSARKALLDMERALALDSTNIDYRLRAGDLQYALLDVEKARGSFDLAMRIAPTDTRPRLKLAEIELVMREYKKSIALVNEALRMEPTAAHGYFLKGWIHMETGDTNKAISSFRTAVEQDPQDYNAYVILGKLSSARHDVLALEYYNTAMELRPNSVEAIYNKAVSCQDHGLDSMALACYDRIKEIDPKNALAWYNSGWVRLEHLGELEEAEKDLSKAIELEPNYADAWYNRGVVMERLAKLDSAAANYQVALSIQPAHDLAARGLDRLAKQGVRIKMREKKG